MRIINWIRLLSKEKVMKEPEKMIWYIHKTEFQIVLQNNTAILSDFHKKSSHKDENMFSDFITHAYKAGVIKLLDKSNKYVTMINTDDIKRILYKPVITEEEG